MEIVGINKINKYINIPAIRCDIIIGLTQVGLHLTESKNGSSLLWISKVYNLVRKQYFFNETLEGYMSNTSAFSHKYVASAGFLIL